jgi:hypothetical protein
MFICLNKDSTNRSLIYYFTIKLANRTNEYFLTTYYIWQKHTKELNIKHKDKNKDKNKDKHKDKHKHVEEDEPENKDKDKDKDKDKNEAAQPLPKPMSRVSC